MGTMNTVSEEQERDSFGDCSYTTNGASPPQTQMTSADKKAAEAKAAEIL